MFGSVGTYLFTRETYEFVVRADLFQMEGLQSAEPHLPFIVLTHLISEEIDISFALPELYDLFVHELYVKEVVVAFIAADQQATRDIFLVMKVAGKAVAFMNIRQLFQQGASVLVAGGQVTDDAVGYGAAIA